MHGAGVDLQLRDLPAREAIAGKHALDRLAQHFGRPPLELLAQRSRPEPAGVAGMAVVQLLVELLTRHRDLLRVDDDHEVARVDVRRVDGLVLAPEGVGDLGRETAERLTLGVDDVPLACDLARLCAVCLHFTERGRTSGAPAADRSRIQAAGRVTNAVAASASASTPNSL